MQTLNFYLVLFLFIVLPFLSVDANGQIINKIRSGKDSIAARMRRMPTMDSLVTKGAEIFRIKKDTLSAKINSLPSYDSLENTARNNVAKRRKNNAALRKQMDFHTNWEQGKVPDFTNAYTLNRHELRLNLFGRSAYAFTDRFEVSSFIPVVFLPNLSFKYRYIDNPHFAAAFEAGVATGALPLAIASGLLLPGAVIGAGTAGVLHGSDYSAKLHATWRPGKKVAFSLRVGASGFKTRYIGVIGGAGLGSGGGLIGFLPVDKGLIRATWLMAGFEIDYAINKRNIIVLRGSINSITTPRSRMNDTGMTAGRNYLSYPSLSYTHAWNHFHLTAGLFDLYYPPEVRSPKGSAITGSEYVNVYWLLNNGKRKKVTEASSTQR